MIWLGRISLQPVYIVHWLAVNGGQPLIPKNESMEDNITRSTFLEDKAFVKTVDRKP